MAGRVASVRQSAVFAARRSTRNPVSFAVSSFHVRFTPPSAAEATSAEGAAGAAAGEVAKYSSTPSRMARATIRWNAPLCSAALSGIGRSMNATSIRIAGRVASRFSP